MDKKNETTGHLLAIITIFIWGTTFISTKVLLRISTPIEILFIRFVIGFIALHLAYPHRFRVKERRQELYFAGAGLCGITLYFLLENIALTFTFASNVGIIISVAPFFTALFAHFFLQGERLKPQFFIGFIIALGGIFLISFNGARVLKLNPLGDILAVLAAIVWAAYSIFTRKISTFQYNTIQATRHIFFYGLVFMIPALFFFDIQLNMDLFRLPVNLLNILFLGLGASAVCFVTWNYAVDQLGAVKTSVYIYLVPVVTVVTSGLVLEERITLVSVFGVLLTLIGLVLSEHKIGISKKEEVNNESV